MALSSFLIQPPSAGGAAQAAAVASRSRAATAERPADFAALMRSQAPAAAQGGVATAVGQGVAPRSGGLVLAGRSPSDLLRAQTFNKAQADLRQTKALEGLMQSMGGSSTLDLARSMGTARHLRALTQGGQSDTLRLGGAGLGDFVRSAGSGARRKAAVPAEETGSRPPLRPV